MGQFTMTEEEKRAYIREVNEEYLKKTPMTPNERKAVRSWMDEGHCILEPWSSRNLPGPMYPPYDFLDCYRLDREVERDTAGMTEEEKIRYLKEMWGYFDDPHDIGSLEDARYHIRQLNRKLFTLWHYLDEEGLWDDAQEYLEEHKDDQMPFDVDWGDLPLED